MPLEGLSFVKILAAFRNIYATEPLLQNLPPLTHPLNLNYVRQFFKNKGSFSHTTSEMKSVTPNFVCISETNNSLFDCSKNV